MTQTNQVQNREAITGVLLAAMEALQNLQETIENSPRDDSSQIGATIGTHLETLTVSHLDGTIDAIHNAIEVTI